MLCLAERSACSAADTLFPDAACKIRTARPSSFWFVISISISRFSYECPISTIAAVLSMFRTIFCAVPAFSLVDPVSTSGPTSGAMKMSVNFLNCPSRFAATPIVVAPCFFAYFTAPSTYGVVALAATPTTTSRLDNFARRKSFTAFFTESSAPSTALVIARRPPAINACTVSREIPNVG